MRCGGRAGAPRSSPRRSTTTWRARPTSTGCTPSTPRRATSPSTSSRRRRPWPATSPSTGCRSSSTSTTSPVPSSSPAGSPRASSGRPGPPRSWPSWPRGAPGPGQEPLQRARRCGGRGAGARPWCRCWPTTGGSPPRPTPGWPPSWPRAARRGRCRHPLRRPGRALQGPARAGQGAVGLPPPLRRARPPAPGRRDARATSTSQALLGFVDDLGLSEAVRITGEVSDASLAAHYAAADVYLSLSAHEGFGVPLVEAMAAGVPVVTRRRRGGGATRWPTPRSCSRPADPSYVAAALHRGLHGRAPAGHARRVRPAPGRRPGGRRGGRGDRRRDRRRRGSAMSAEGGLRHPALRHCRSWAAPRRRCATWPSTSAPGPAGRPRSTPRARSTRSPGPTSSSRGRASSTGCRCTATPPRTGACPTSTAWTGCCAWPRARRHGEQGTRWVDYNGPVSPQLVEAVCASDADVVAFTPYLYHPTVATIGRVPMPAVFHPAAHDEPALYLSVFRGTFGRRRRLLLLHGRRAHPGGAHVPGGGAAPDRARPRRGGLRGTRAAPVATCSVWATGPTSSASGGSTSTRAPRCWRRTSRPTRSATPGRSHWRWSARSRSSCRRTPTSW